MQTISAFLHCLLKTPNTTLPIKKDIGSIYYVDHAMSEHNTASAKAVNADYNNSLLLCSQPGDVLWWLKYKILT